MSAVVHLQVHWDKEEVRIFEVGVASEAGSTCVGGELVFGVASSELV